MKAREMNDPKLENDLSVEIDESIDPKSLEERLKDLWKKEEEFMSDEQILLKCDAKIKNEDIYPPQPRVYAIGDIHGDLEAFLVLFEEVCQVCCFNCPIRNNKNIKDNSQINKL